MPYLADPKVHRNILAFLDAIAETEGTDNGRQPTEHNGYDVLVGGKLFTDFSRHPNILVTVNKAGLKSTAAGRYQLLYRYWHPYCVIVGRSDFQPETQDLIAIQQMKEKGCIPWLVEGNITEAVRRANRIWASLPESPYGQRTESWAAFRAIFESKGGRWVR